MEAGSIQLNLNITHNDIIGPLKIHDLQSGQYIVNFKAPNNNPSNWPLVF